MALLLRGTEPPHRNARPGTALIGMDTQADKELDRLIVSYARDPTAMKQLKRLPAFVVPKDTDEMFRDLLDRLDRAGASRQ